MPQPMLHALQGSLQGSVSPACPWALEDTTSQALMLAAPHNVRHAKTPEAAVSSCMTHPTQVALSFAQVRARSPRSTSRQPFWSCSAGSASASWPL